MNLSTDALTKDKNKTPFRFDISFDDGESLDTPFLITYRELEVLKQKAFEEGMSKGEHDMQNSIHAAVDIVLQTINAEVMDIDQKQIIFQNTLAAETLDLVEKITALVFPGLAETVILDEIKKLMGVHMEVLRDQTALQLVLSPRIFKYLQERQEEGHPFFADTIKLIENPDFSLGEYRLEWPTGSIRKNERELLKNVGEAIAHMKDHLEPRQDVPDVRAAEEKSTDAPSSIHTDESILPQDNNQGPLIEDQKHDE